MFVSSWCVHFLCCVFFFFAFYDLHNFFLFEFNSHILYFDVFLCVFAIIYMFSTWCSDSSDYSDWLLSWRERERMFSMCVFSLFLSSCCSKFNSGYLTAIVIRVFSRSLSLVGDSNLYNFEFLSFLSLNHFHHILSLSFFTWATTPFMQCENELMDI